jgi:general secretion pathway protein L
MSRKVLGLDIRRHSLAAVLLKSSLRENRIEAHGVFPIEESAEAGNGLAAALREMSQRMDLSGCDYVVSVPADLFSFRNLKIPFKDPKKIRMVLPLELEAVLPYQGDELVMDFQQVYPGTTSEQADLIAAAVEKARLNPILDTLLSFKIDPEILTISGLPAALLLAKNADAQEDQLLINVEEGYSTLYLCVDGQLQLMRAFPVPPQNSHRPRQLCAGIRHTLAAFEQLNQTDFEPHEAVVTGSALNGLNLREDVAGLLETTVTPADLMRRLNIPSDAPVDPAWNPASMDNALATALMDIEGLKGLNFHTERFAATKFFAKYKSGLIKTGILAAAALILLIFNVFFESYLLSHRIERLDREITEIFKTTFPDVQRIVDPYQQMRQKLQEIQKSEPLSPETSSRPRSIDILDSISRSIPKETTVDLDRLVIGTEDVLISGTTDTFNSVDAIKGDLEKIQSFKKVTITSANLERSGNQVRFMLKVEL